MGRPSQRFMVASTVGILKELLSFGVWASPPLPSHSDIASSVCRGTGDTQYPSVRIHHLNERWSRRWVPCGCWCSLCKLQRQLLPSHMQSGSHDCSHIFLK